MAYEKVQKWKWFNLISIVIFHAISFVAFFWASFEVTKPLYTYSWMLFTTFFAGFGVTAGVHRYWCHKSYKANLPMRILLATCYSVSGQNSIFDWVRDHRIHHKYSDTDADPHNATRGFWFSHVGWLTMNKHPDVIAKGRVTHMDDVMADPVVAFHTKYFWPIKIFCCFVGPVLLPVYGWNETWTAAILTQIFMRYPFTLNATWSVNSAAHMWGNRPYDGSINPVENPVVAKFSLGEGWHNYHHVFPYDYKASELGPNSNNFTTILLDFFARYGWVYDRKQPSRELIEKIAANKGDKFL